MNIKVESLLIVDGQKQKTGVKEKYKRENEKEKQRNITNMYRLRRSIREKMLAKRS